MLHDGLKIKWLSFEGYVHRDHLPNPCEPLDKQSRLDNVSAEATVLYSLPMIRCVHFTMQSPPALSLECFDPCLADDGITHHVKLRIPSHSTVAGGPLAEPYEPCPQIEPTCIPPIACQTF